MKKNPLPLHLNQHRTIHHGGRRAFSAQNRNLIDFSSNITPLGTPPAVLQALKRCATNRHTSEYPDPKSSALRASLSRYLRIPEPNIILGSGAIEIIYNAALALGHCKGRILLQSPTFQEYEAALHIHHGHNNQLVHFKSLDLASNLERFIDCIPRNGLVFVCNPNNPTGAILTQDQVMQIIDTAASKQCHIVVDECFIEMSSDPYASVISRVREYDNLVVIRSMTKSFGLPGIRIGYAAATYDTADILYRIKIPWSITHMAEAAGIAALKKANDTLEKTARIICKERAYLQNRLSRIDGISHYDTAANFILLKTKLDATILCDMLAKRYGILARNCSDFRGLGRHHIRIAIKKHSDNRALADALEKIMMTTVVKQ